MFQRRVQTFEIRFCRLHSIRLFWRGVPVSTTLRRVLMEFIALDTAEASFFNTCPSSQITKSGPVSSICKEAWKTKKKLQGQCLHKYRWNPLWNSRNCTYTDKSDNAICCKGRRLKQFDQNSYFTWINECFLECFFQLFALNVAPLREVAVHFVADDHDATVFLPSL